MSYENNNNAWAGKSTTGLNEKVLIKYDTMKSITFHLKAFLPLVIKHFPKKRAEKLSH